MGESPQLSHPPRTLWLATLAAALAIIAIILGTHSLHAHAAKPTITSIAVLPLDNLSGDPSQDYLAAGMTDELTTQLAKDSNLRVISRTSVMQFKGARRPLPEIARALNVDGILEGSIARTGDNLHMTVQLIHAPTDTHLWAESYDRSSNDIVSLPRDAALTIASETRSAVASAAPQKYVNPAAHDAYLRGNFHWYSGDQVRAGQYFLKATQIQPDYAPAWAGLSSSYGAGAADEEVDPRTAIPLAVSAAQKALQLDPSLAEAHVAYGAAKYWLSDWNLNAAMNEFKRAIELDPKYSQAWHMTGKILLEQGHYQQGVEYERKSMEIEPFDRPWGMPWAFLLTRNFDAAISEANQRLDAHPDAVTWWVLGRAYDAKGMDKQSEHAMEQFFVLTNQPRTAESLHRAYASGSHKAVLRWQIADLKAQSAKQYASPYVFATYYAELGDKQQAFAWLDEALRRHDPGLLDLPNDFAFDFLHNDPHYRAIVQKVGLPFHS